MAKTKIDLQEEIRLKNEEIELLKKRVETLKKYEKYEDMADEMKAMHDSFLNAGFSDQQAFELLTRCLSCAAEMSGKKGLF